MLILSYSWDLLGPNLLITDKNPSSENLMPLNLLMLGGNIVYRNTWLGNQKLLIFDPIVNIILDYLKKTVHNVFTITTNIQGGVL